MENVDDRIDLHLDDPLRQLNRSNTSPVLHQNVYVDDDDDDDDGGQHGGATGGAERTTRLEQRAAATAARRSPATYQTVHLQDPEHTPRSRAGHSASLSYENLAASTLAPRPVGKQRLGTHNSSRFREQFELTAVTTPQPLSYQEQQSEALLLVKNSEAAYIQNHTQRHTFLMMEDPSSSRLALYVHILLAGVILLNAVTLCLDTLPAFFSVEAQLGFLVLEFSFTCVFLAEFLARTYAHAYSWESALRYSRRPLVWVDIMAFVPFFCEWLIYRPFFVHPAIPRTSPNFYRYESHKFSVLKLLRLFRLFKVYKYEWGLQLSIEVMMVAMNRSSNALLVLGVFIISAIIIFGTLIYFFERGVFDESKNVFVDPQFQSIPSSIWYVMSTLTSTGYGDVVPSTTMGRFITFLIMMIGVLLVALPSIIVGRNYLAVWDVMKLYQRPAATATRPATGGFTSMPTPLMPSESAVDGDERGMALPPNRVRGKAAAVGPSKPPIAGGGPSSSYEITVSQAIDMTAAAESAGGAANVAMQQQQHHQDFSEVMKRLDTLGEQMARTNAQVEALAAAMMVKQQQQQQ